MQYIWEITKVNKSIKYKKKVTIQILYSQTPITTT